MSLYLINKSLFKNMLSFIHSFKSEKDNTTILDQSKTAKTILFLGKRNPSDGYCLQESCVKVRKAQGFVQDSNCTTSSVSVWPRIQHKVPCTTWVDVTGSSVPRKPHLRSTFH